MARDETARGAVKKRSLLDRRSYLKLASASVATVGGIGVGSGAAQSSDVLFHEDFSSSNYDQRFTSAWRQGHYDQLTSQAPKTGSSCLRVELPSGSHYGMDATTDPRKAGLVDQNPRELYASYWVKFSDDFDFGGDTHANKLPGFEYDEGVSDMSGDGDGWTARGMFRNEGGDVMVGYYVYHMDMPGEYGDDFNATTVSRGEWHHIEQYVKLNTADGSVNRDGELTMWVDGNREVHDTSMKFTHTPSNGINYAFQVYYGGSASSPADNAICIDEWILAKSRVDGSGSGGGAQTQTGDRLELVSKPEAQAAEYEFTVKGSVQKNTSANSLSAEDNDSITNNGDGTVTVTGVSGNGNGDSFWVDGTVQTMSIDESLWTIRYKDKEVSVADITASTGPAIDRFDVSPSDRLGDKRMFSVRWAVSAADDALDTVEVVAVEGTADMNFAVTDVGGASASGWDLFQFPVGTELDVNLRAKDAAGNVTKRTKSVTL